MHFVNLSEALTQFDERPLAVAAEKLAEILDQAAGNDAPSAHLRTLVTRWSGAHPAARQTTSAELGRLAGLADLITAGLVTNPAAAIAAALARPAKKKTAGRPSPAA